jgi:hypothetical protein
VVENTASCALSAKRENELKRQYAAKGGTGWIKVQVKTCLNIRAQKACVCEKAEADSASYSTVLLSLPWFRIMVVSSSVGWPSFHLCSK